MTDVHFHPTDSAHGLGGRSTQLGTASGMHHVTGLDPKANFEATEMAAFEKGRMQGEMEAIRRMENDQSHMQLKQFPLEQHPVAQLQKPDVIEINRLTWLQRGAWALGELTGLATIALTIVWIMTYRNDFAWANSETGGIGSVGMWNTHLMCSILGLFFLAQAITLYRVLPLNTNPGLNKALYIFNYSCAIVCFIMSLVGQIRSTPETTFWAVDNWCFALALIVVTLHGLYSMARTLMERRRPVHAETWTETNNKLTFESPEQKRDHSAYNQAGRAVYTPAPVYVPRSGLSVPPANANVGAQVPIAPANAPRWAENPNTHAEDYFLMPRAKWAVCGFVGMGASILMMIAALEHILATGHNQWSQDNVINPGGLQQNRREAHIIGSIGVLLLSFVLLIAYAAMPPRTTLVKNGILQDQNNRRSSISHNAETRLGPSMV